MSETKREYYIRNLEEILESDVIKITHEAYFTEGAIKELLELLKAEPERKTGQWQEDPSGYGFWICSACGFVSEASGADLLYNFCPNCGADMRGENNDL